MKMNKEFMVLQALEHNGELEHDMTGILNIIIWRDFGSDKALIPLNGWAVPGKSSYIKSYKIEKDKKNNESFNQRFKRALRRCFQS